MQSYTYAPKSDNKYDIEICNRKNEIQRLNEEIKSLELQKSKEDKNYIGRIFEDEDDNCLYVTHAGFDNELYCTYFEFFELEVDIKSGIVFNENMIKEEITMSQLRHKIGEVSKWLNVLSIN